MVFKTTKNTIIKFVNVSSKRKNTPNKVKPKVLEKKKKVIEYDNKKRIPNTWKKPKEDNITQPVTAKREFTYTKDVIFMTKYLRYTQQNQIILAQKEFNHLTTFLKIYQNELEIQGYEDIVMEFFQDIDKTILKLTKMFNVTPNTIFKIFHEVFMHLMDKNYSQPNLHKALSWNKITTLNLLDFKNELINYFLQ